MAKILIVDDEINIIKTISAILSDEGHEIDYAQTGDEAINLIKKNRIDLVGLVGKAG